MIDITHAQSSEEPMRNLYRRWAQFMEADSWDELATWRHAVSDRPIAAHRHLSLPLRTRGQ